MAFTGSNNCIGNCDFAANRDSDCSGSLKCCSNGCAEFCVRPFTGYGFLVNGRWPININGNYIRESKPGSCPATYTGWSIRNCQPICWADRDCSGSQKCCADTGCPYCADVGPVLPIKTTQITTRALLLRKSDRKLGLHRATDPERRVVPLEHTNLARFMPRKVIVSPGPVYVAPRVRAAEPIRLVATQQQPAPSPRIVQPVYQRAVQTFERAAPAPVVPQPSWRSRG
ncbi:hypothetical protein BV898_02471 [Hypsibius exemplaris]|uniref:WAP domain-containing protein n=1 Tax=Hypsibius exemplaris TaxID=2072580 RepID=A0A1W0X879_HYPEX|nr:hypothetical protein BV898_02471 [Hypsibius exemplaris]